MNEQGVSLPSEPGAEQTLIREAFCLLSHLLELLKRNRSKTQKAWLYFCPFSCPLSLAQRCFACGSCRTHLQDSPLPVCEIFWGSLHPSQSSCFYHDSSLRGSPSSWWPSLVLWTAQTSVCTWRQDQRGAWATVFQAPSAGCPFSVA